MLSGEAGKEKRKHDGRGKASKQGVRSGEVSASARSHREVWSLNYLSLCQVQAGKLCFYTLAPISHWWGAPRREGAFGSVHVQGSRGSSHSHGPTPVTVTPFPQLMESFPESSLSRPFCLLRRYQWNDITGLRTKQKGTPPTRQTLKLCISWSTLLSKPALLLGLTCKPGSANQTHQRGYFSATNDREAGIHSWQGGGNRSRCVQYLGVTIVSSASINGTSVTSISGIFMAQAPWNYFEHHYWTGFCSILAYSVSYSIF